MKTLKPFFWRQWGRTKKCIEACAPAHMCGQVGLVNIVTTPQPEVTQRTDPDFAMRLGLWAEVVATRGRQMVSDGVMTGPQRAAAETEYRAWLHDHATSQYLYLMAVEGIRPP
jgi:hypothetical protein